MADVTYHVFYQNPFQATADAARTALTYTSEGTVGVDGPTLTTIGGYRTWLISLIYSGGTYIEDYYYILATVAEDAIIAMPMAPLAQDTTVLRVLFDPTSSEEPRWETWLGDWEDIFLGTYVEFFNEVLGASTEEIAAFSLTNFSGMIGTATLGIKVTVDTMTWIWQTTLVGEQVFDSGDSVGTQLIPSSANSVVTVVAGGSSQELSRIAQATEDIAMQDYEIGLNNGQSIFRVKGRSTISGAGGGG